MIQIIGNVGNQGYALPMVSAYPLNLNLQQLLAWNPVEQALDYVPYFGNAEGDFTVTRDLTVGRNLVVTGTTSLPSTVITSIVSSGSISAGINLIATAVVQGATGSFSGDVAALSHTAVLGANNAQLTSAGLAVQALPVIGTRRTGWAAATGTATRTTFATGAVTLPQLAERVKALIDDLTAHGMIGA